jgi:hypothetical protein
MGGLQVFLNFGYLALRSAALLLGLVVLSGCSDDKTKSPDRSPGDPLGGRWYVPIRDEACTFDALVLSLDSGKFAYQMKNEVRVYQVFSIKDQSNSSFTMVTEHIYGPYKGTIDEIVYEDRGSELIATSVNGKGAETSKLSAMANSYKSCSNISFWASLKLKFGLSKEFSKNPTLKN